MADEQSQPANVQQRSTDNKVAEAGFACGFLGLLSVWVPFLGLILAGLGVVLGAIGVGEAHRFLGFGKWFGIAGIVLGAVTIWLTFAVLNTMS